MKIKNRTRKMSIFVLCFLWLAIIAVGGTVAYIFTATQQVVNTFAVPSDGSSVVEEIDGNVKEQVVIANTGNVDSYIRAKVIFTWQNAAGVVHPTKVKESDYEITLNLHAETAGAWSVINGMYYYNGVVKANDNNDSTIVDQTSPLYTNCKPKAEGPEEGYTLHVEILSQSIQSEPIAAVQEAWNMTYDVATSSWSVVTSTSN